MTGDRPATYILSLVNELCRSGLIDNRGSRSKPRWVAVDRTPAEDAR